MQWVVVVSTGIGAPVIVYYGSENVGVMANKLKALELEYTEEYQVDLEKWHKRFFNYYKKYTGEIFGVDRSGKSQGVARQQTYKAPAFSAQSEVEASLWKKTHAQYEQIFQRYIQPRLGKIKITNLRPDIIQDLYDQMVKDGISPRTVQLTHAVLRRCLYRAVRLGLLASNPARATSPPRPALKEMRILDDNKIQQLLLAASAIQPRNTALYQLAITTSMRQGELLGLKWQDVNWAQSSIRIQHQLYYFGNEGPEFSQPKTNARVRTLLIGQTTLAVLRDHQSRQNEEIQRAGERWQNHDLVFPSTVGTPTNPHNLLKQYKRLLQLTGLPNIRFHDLRHTAASLMLNNGVPLLVASRRLGHAYPSITLDVYGHMVPSMQEEAARILDELVTPIEIEAVAPGCTTMQESSKR